MTTVTQLQKKYPVAEIIGALLLNYAALWLFWPQPWLVFWITLCAGILLITRIASRRVTATYIFLALTMPITEILAVHLGIWTYAAPSFAGVPAYLFSIWGNVAIMALIFYKVLRSAYSEHMPVAQTQRQWLCDVSTFLFTTGGSLLILLALWQQPLIAAASLLVLKGFQIILFHKTQHKTALTLFALTAISGAVIGEITSVTLGIWHYNTATIFGLPLFIYIAWGGTGIIVAEFYTLMSAPYAHTITHKLYRKIFYDGRGLIIGASLIISYCAAFLFWRTPSITLLILTTVSIILLILLRSCKLLLIYLIGGALGTLMESQSTQIGIWHYTIPEWRGVPYYLFPTWGNTTIFAIAAFKKTIGARERLCIPCTKKIAFWRLISTAITTCVALLILWTLWHHILLTATLLLGLGAFYISTLPEHRVMWSIYGATILGGLLTDLVGVPLGIWSYSVSTVHGIPLFMLFAWGLAGIIFVTLYNILAHIPFLNKNN